MPEKRHLACSGEVYEEPLHKQPVFQQYVSAPLTVSEDYRARHICLPIFSGMEKDEVQWVVKALKEAIG